VARLSGAGQQPVTIDAPTGVRGALLRPL